MERHDPNDPTRPDEQPTRGEGAMPPPGGAPPDEPSPAQGDPTGPTVESPAPEHMPAGPRRLFRSRADRVLGGVCGGLGRYIGVDPIVVRILFVVLLFFGGISLIVYLAALLLVPSEPIGGAPGTPDAGASTAGGIAALGGTDRGRTLAIVGLVVLLLVGWPFLLGGGLAIAGLALPLAVLVLVGLAVWWVVSGESTEGGAGDVARRSALGVLVLIACFAVFLAGAWAAGVGGGAVAAGIVIAAGALLVAGAFLGRVRMLILPAVALALGVGVVSAAGIDLSGGVGEREYTPTSAAELRDEYELGMGELVVDLREADLPPGDTQVALRVGLGEAAVLVPRDVCVASTATIGAGNVASFGRDNGGVDLDWEDLPTAAPGSSRLLVDADVGMGEFRVQHGPYQGPGPPHDDSFDGDRPPIFDGDGPNGGDDSSTPGQSEEPPAGNAACDAAPAAASAGG